MIITRQTIGVVTGAGSGIGRALALQLAGRCGGLALADVDSPGLSETVSLIGGESGCHITTHHLDVSQRDQMADFARQVEASHGKVNLLINNAGVALSGTIDDVTIEDIEWLMGINLWGVIFGVKYFLPLLQREPRAHIVNISSVFGMIAPPGQGAYAASKFAVRGFSEALGHELSGSGISVSVVHPGGIRTNIARRARTSAKTSEAEAVKARELFDKAARTSPGKAATTIIDGLERDRRRILIGPDAWLIDRVQRLLPVKHGRLLEVFFKR
jgi:NAD(P)-dependent dehydrogenase (short-subunit alcohol dehydrogenase family)